MTDANGTPGGIAPGWYADPSGAAQQRWWDGTQWTEHLAPSPQPVAPARPSYSSPVKPVRPPLDPATPVGTVWIWLVVLLPVLTIVLLPTVQICIPTFDLNDPTPAVDPLALIGGPWYIVLMAVTWLSYAALVVFSWLDHQELTRRGVVRPFHWAWSFLSNLVYVIGRTVILRGVAQKRGMAPLWAAIAVTVLALIVSIVWSVLLIVSMFDQISYIATYAG